MNEIQNRNEVANNTSHLKKSHPVQDMKYQLNCWKLIKKLVTIVIILAMQRKIATKIS